MDKDLMNQIVEMMPRIKNRNESFNEKEMIPIKSFFEEITGVKFGNMMNCGGKLCEDVRRSICNYMASYSHIKTEQPKQTKPPKKETKPSEPTRGELMAEALKIAEAKEIKKPHFKSGIDKLKKYINENK